ncbi:hypothetical protein BGZ82_008903 [Podila clonocystis]|nr:hypothetical protein BGZ82_008903 [Podila clonocystis]
MSTNASQNAFMRQLSSFRRGSVATFESASTMVGSTGSLDGKVKGADDKMLALETGSDSDEGSLSVPASMQGAREGGVSTFKTCAALVDTRRTSYQDIAKAAYGPVGHYVAFTVVAVNLFGCAVLYTILPATLMQDMLATYAFVHVPTYALVAACSAFVWACLICTKTMKEVAWLSILGAAATIGVVCITVGVSAAQLVNKAAAIVAATHKLVDWSKIPLSLATISFAYGGNVVYPHMEASMARPRAWPRALWCALSFCFGMYMLIAVVGYLAFGAGTESPVLRNLPNGAWSIIANSLITIHVLLAAPILLTSLSMMAEASLAHRYPKFEHGPARGQFLKRGLLRTGIVLLVGLVATVVPFFGDVMDLLGALTACLLVFIMPVMFYYRLGGLEKKGWATRAWAVVILLVGAVALVLGTLDAVRHLAADFRRE